jgi:hypothetical protein
MTYIFLADVHTDLPTSHGEGLTLRSVFYLLMLSLVYRSRKQARRERKRCMGLAYRDHQLSHQSPNRRQSNCTHFEYVTFDRRAYLSDHMLHKSYR